MTQDDNPNLTKCLDCNGNVSKNASSCPHCGAPINDGTNASTAISRGSGLWGKVGGVLGALIVLAVGARFAERVFADREIDCDKVENQRTLACVRQASRTSGDIESDVADSEITALIIQELNSDFTGYPPSAPADSRKFSIVTRKRPWSCNNFNNGSCTSYSHYSALKDGSDGYLVREKFLWLGPDNKQYTVVIRSNAHATARGLCAAIATVENDDVRVTGSGARKEEVKQQIFFALNVFSSISESECVEYDKLVCRNDVCTAREFVSLADGRYATDTEKVTFLDYEPRLRLDE